MPLRTADNNFGTAKWIVSANYSDGCTHTTIASALTSASSGDTIFIRTGTYIENLTLKSGVNLVAFQTDNFTPNVIISGKCSASFVGTCSISGIQLKTNSDFALEVTGSSATIVNLFDCFIQAQTTTPLSYTSSSSSSSLNLYSCQADFATTGIALFSSSGAGIMQWNNCTVNNTGATSTATTFSAGTLRIQNSIFRCPITTSGGSINSLLNSQIDCSSLNVAALTTGTGGIATIYQCIFLSGTASAISVGASTTVNIYNSNISSTNTNAITGAGTINYDTLSFSNTSLTINTTTQTTKGTNAGLRAGANPSIGYLGESISSAVGLTTVTTTATSQNLTTISLTPGVWDVSGAVTFQSGGVAGSSYNLGVNTVSATLGTLGDNFYGVAVSALNQSITVPQKRITISATTTVYLVVQATFTSTMSAAGRISATRVG